MKRSCSTLVLGATLALGLAAGPTAAPAAAASPPSCTTMSITVYRDIYYSGPHAWFCSGISGVGSLGYLDGPCGFFGDWNDCASSFTADVPAGWCLRLYRDAGFKGLEYAFRGRVHVSYAVLAGGNNDTLSSIQFFQC
jgi:hypothetical protein